mgnify:CR=1 FL=1
MPVSMSCARHCGMRHAACVAGAHGAVVDRFDARAWSGRTIERGAPRGVAQRRGRVTGATAVAASKPNTSASSEPGTLQHPRALRRDLARRVRPRRLPRARRPEPRPAAGPPRRLEGELQPGATASGCWCFGETQMRTFLDSAAVSRRTAAKMRRPNRTSGSFDPANSRHARTTNLGSTPNLDSRGHERSRSFRHEQSACHNGEREPLGRSRVDPVFRTPSLVGAEAATSPWFGR